jgi:hypothetical protein
MLALIAPFAKAAAPLQDAKPGDLKNQKLAL